MVLIVVNMFAGIIIDTFGSLREKDKEKDEDVRDKCFVCGNDRYIYNNDSVFNFIRETFDRKTELKGGFIGHIKIDHYMWNYVNYIAYLKEKDSTDYTGIESYISEKLEENDVSWFPSHK